MLEADDVHLHTHVQSKIPAKISMECWHSDFTDNNA